MFAEVIIDVSNSEVDRVFDYALIEGVKLGHRVLVPFSNRLIEGYVIGLKESTDCPPQKIKEIAQILDIEPVIIIEMLELTGFLRDRYNLRLIDALRLFIPAQMRGGRIKELKRLFVTIKDEFLYANPDEFIKKTSIAQHELFDHLKQSGGDFLSEISKNFSAAAYRNLLERGIIQSEGKKVDRTPFSHAHNQNGVNLTAEQQKAVQTISSGNKIFLLHGVTGSGKTEVYLRCIENALKNGKTAIMLVPEISLTPQIFSIFRSRFADKVAILHSGLSAGERFDEWQRLLTGEALVAIGARSAIFAPLKNVGLIIIDEEHDSSYNSESNPRYITSEAATFRQKFNNCALVLGSATPSVETYYRAEKGDYTLIEMNNRINNSLPHIKVVNMCNEVYKGNNSLFSLDLTQALGECIANKNQAMLFINRRGYSSFVRCTSCGYVAVCERCDVSLVYHREEYAPNVDGLLKCHYCGNRYNVPKACPKCGEAALRRGYVGTQQVEEKLKEMFPSVRLLRMDNDTTQTKDAHADILGRFKAREADVLIGTQMIAKGHDFPLVTLVGIIDADISLHFSDYKSAERTYQLITQVSGRAGRAELEGNVILQTYSPNHYAYKFAVSNDYRGFYKKELNLREVTAFPPFSTIVRILLCGGEERETAQLLKEIYTQTLELSKIHKEAFAFLTYMHSPVKRIKDLYRMQILMRITNSFDEIVKKIYNMVNGLKRKNVSVFVEINPNNLS